MDFSVVIPAYNAERFLERAVNSVVSQQDAEFEVIIVDDGSTDGTPAICDTLCVRYDNVYCIHQENQGVSRARENGVRSAKGDFVLFLDADDQFVENALSVIRKEILACPDADIFQFGYDFVDEQDRVIQSRCESREIICSPEECVRFQLTSPKSITSVCTKVFRRRLMDGYTFPDLRLSEDYATMIQILGKTQKMIVIEEILYRYTYNLKSATHIPYKEFKLDGVKALQLIVDYVEREFPQLAWYAHERMCWGIFEHYRGVRSAPEISKERKKELLRWLKGLIKSEYAVLKRDREKLRNFQKSKQGILVSMFNYLPEITACLYSLHLERKTQ